MAFRLIIGGSGSGKSRRLYQELIERSLEHPKENYIVLVPEQFTMQTQKELVMQHPARGILNIDVLSFQRLAYRVFDEVGGNTRRVLEETGKSLVIRRLAQEHRGELSVLGEKLLRMGYVGEMKSVLSELTQYNVGREQLLAAAKEAGDNRLLKEKLSDILVLQDAFRAYKEERYITAEEILEELRRAADRSDLLRDSVLALDGFAGFTPIQYALLGKLFVCAKEVLITVTMDVREYPFTSIHEEELFAPSKRTIWELRRLAQESGTREEEPWLLGGETAPRFREAEALNFLERHLLRYDGAVYEKEQDSIRILRAADPEQEAEAAAREIGRLVREEGFRYREIAVITGDMEGYCPYIERQFADSGIPCFIDHKRDILANPFAEFLRSVLEMLEEQFSYDSVFRYLRSGLSGIPADAVDRMDNYCVAMGIRGYRQYASAWERTYPGQDAAELALLNETREAFADQIRELRERYMGRGRTVRERTEGLFRWCERLRIQEQLKRFETAFREQKLLALSREYAQIYRIVIELFDKLVELMGEEKIPLKEYAKILEAGLEEARVGVVPPSQDEVMVGDMERTRLKDIRALFLLGANDGILPANGGGAGILSELDREQLKRLRLPLAPDRKENMYIQRFYLYQNLTKPSGRLYVSCSIRGRKGESLRPSYLIGQLQDLYPGLPVHRAGEDLLSRAVSVRQGFLKLAEEISEGRLAERETNVLGRYYAERAQGKERLRALSEAASERKPRLSLDRAVARALYGETLSGSVTRLERYAACAYAHFLTYGLRLRERQEYTFAALDLGNILHQALERYTGALKEGPYTWFDIPGEAQRELMDRCVEEAAASYGSDILRSSHRNAYMTERMKQMGRRTVWALTEQVRRGKLIPQGFEVEFSAADHLHAVSMRLPDGTPLKLAGRIDRTDVCEDEERVYVKVIDYKTGAKTFDAGEVFYGLSLQLVVYLSAAMEMEARTHREKTVVPAAMLYYQIKDPILEAEEPMSEGELSEALLRELCTRGLVNESPDVIALLDARMGASSSVIPAGKTKSGELSARSSAASARRMEALAAHARRTMVTFGEEIMNGNISIAPYQKGDRTACGYCPYKGVCGFDAKLPGHAFRKLSQLSAKDVWEKLEGEEDGSAVDS